MSIQFTTDESNCKWFELNWLALKSNNVVGKPYNIAVNNLSGATFWNLRNLFIDSVLCHIFSSRFFLGMKFAINSLPALTAVSKNK